MDILELIEILKLYNGNIKSFLCIDAIKLEKPKDFVSRKLFIRSPLNYSSTAQQFPKLFLRGLLLNNSFDVSFIVSFYLLVKLC